MTSYNIREKAQQMQGGIPTEMFISQQPKAIESRIWYQMIAMTIFYNHVIKYTLKISYKEATFKLIFCF